MTAGRHRAPRERAAYLDLVRYVLAGVLLAAAVAVALPSEARATGEDGSAVTVNGTGEFSGLRVTVDQTTDLINQVVRVSWTGGRPTAPVTGSFHGDFLQVMQCWGDAGGPKREQCQYGALYGDGRGGPWAASRQTSYGQSLVDPEETYVQAPGTYTPAYVPFESVTGKTVSGALNEFFDGYSTNEVPFARTGADGSGEEFFEVQTAREAPGLGCGERLTGGARSCWLVVVPRGQTEVDGRPASETPFHAIASSPLSASNWKHRIVIPLSFQPIGLACPIGAAERPTVGQEPIAEAIVRWQPMLCRGGTIFGYSQVADDLARRQLAAERPALAFVSRPVPDDPSIAYAPVALSGLTVALNLELQPGRDAPASVKGQSGRRITDVRLTPRLVAKLLTQSYVAASLAVPPAMKDNPYDLTRDPDFLALNPSFRDYYVNNVATLGVPLGMADATTHLWEWLRSDADAAAFLAGRPDPWGAVLNPHYKAMSLPRPDFPKSDPGCQEFGDGRPALCTLDAYAYAADYHEAARGAARGDTLARTLWDPSASPPSWRRSPLQLSGSRAVAVLADTATAARYSLTPASLRNAAGKFVTPTDASLLAALGAARKDGDVLVPDPSAKVAAAYPLPVVTYAAAAPSRLGAADAKAYADLVRYAAGDGQVPGTQPGRLPEGYVPLPDALRAQAKATAARIVTRDATPPPAATTPPVATVPPARGGPAATPAGSAAPVVPSGPAAAPGAGPAAAPKPATAAPRPVAFVPPAPTPAVPVGAARYALSSLLVLGAAASAAGPLLRRASRPRRAARHA